MDAIKTNGGAGAKPMASNCELIIGIGKAGHRSTKARNRGSPRGENRSIERDAAARGTGRNARSSDRTTAKWQIGNAVIKWFFAASQRITRAINKGTGTIDAIAQLVHQHVVAGGVNLLCAADVASIGNKTQSPAGGN